MSEQMTKPTATSVEAFIDAVENPRRREDARTLVSLFSEVSDEAPVMWGPSMIGFGSFHYRYASGHEGDTFKIGFSPRKSNLVLYINRSGDDVEALVGKLGKFRSGAGCLYVNRLSDIDLGVLRDVATRSLAYLKATYGP